MTTSVDTISHAIVGAIQSNFGLSSVYTVSKEKQDSILRLLGDLVQKPVISSVTDEESVIGIWKEWVEHSISPNAVPLILSIINGFYFHLDDHEGAIERVTNALCIKPYQNYMNEYGLSDRETVEVALRNNPWYLFVCCCQLVGWRLVLDVALEQIHSIPDEVSNHGSDT